MDAGSFAASDAGAPMSGPHFGAEMEDGERGGAEGMAEPEPEAPPEEESTWPPAECPDNGPTSLFLSADDSNSQASPVLARKLIRAGRYVPASVIRTYEFLNYADFAYEAPESGLAIHPELRPSDEGPGQYDLQIAVRAPDMDHGDARPLNLVLVLDSSGSMAGPPLALLRRSVRILLESLEPGALVSAVRLDANSEVLLEGVAAEEVDTEALLEALVPNGVTDLETALRLAYEQAVAHHDQTRLSRVILFSDGAANAGETSIELIAQHAGEAEQEGIYLAGVGLGEGFNDSLMDAVTDAGKGAYFLLDAPEEADRMFGSRLLSNLEIAALNVRVELALPSRWQMLVFHGEEVSTEPEEVKPQNLAPNDQMIFNQVIGTCAPDDTTGEEEFRVVARYTDARQGQSQEVDATFTLDEILGEQADNLAKGKGLVAFAEGIKELWPLRTGTAAAKEEACTKMLDALDAAPEDDDITEARALAAAYCDIIRDGEQHAGSCDCGVQPSFAASLGVCDSPPEATRALHTAEGAEGESWGSFGGLYEGIDTAPREGCSFAALSSGNVGERETIPGASRSCAGGAGGSFTDPMPRWYGDREMQADGANICDLAQVELELTAPADAHSFSFDFRFFSAEYPDYIGSQYNDTFYAILQADSTHDGQPTNISFDAAGKAIEINNNYFANPFHPCSERGSGFVYGGSTCWLRTSWPIEPGETFVLTFSVHDEGDAIYSSTVLLDNFRFHPDAAVGMTDPLN